jgi:hypothetical protein
MPIETTLQSRYAVQKVFVIAVFLVMGLWGLYDYIVKIPRRERAYERGQICFTVKEALAAAAAEPGASSRTKAADARNTVDAAITALLTQGMRKDDGAPPPTNEEVLRAVRKNDDEDWLKLLVVFHLALVEAERLTPGASPSAAYTTIYDLAEQAVGATSGVKKPNKFDRITQWLFILCLPAVPYLAWQWVQARRQFYRLDDAGTLTGPGFSWARDDIADIDMGRWMAKSVASVVHRDGTRVRLDDYVHRNTHLIVGAIASRMYPDAWTEEARRRNDTAGGPIAPAEANGESDAGEE